MLEVKNAFFGYSNGHHILKNINLQLTRGQVLSVLGPNGVGKTTLLKCIMNILTWTKGESLLNDVPIKQIAVQQLWKTIAYVPQAKNSIFSYSSEEMILMGRSAHIGLFAQPSKKDMVMVERVMETLGILHLRGKLCNQMSGGELQMVLIGRALISNPQILILDEPESNLDFKNQLVVLDTIHALADREGIACLFNTHYPSHALKVSTHSLILNKRGDSIFGKSKSIITEQNLRASFDVDVHINEVTIEDKHHQSVIPLGIVKSSSS